MAELESIGNYQAVVFGFDDVLVNMALARSGTLTAASQSIAEKTGDYRLNNIHESSINKPNLDGLSEAEKIARSLYDALIIDDEDPDDWLVQTLLATRAEIYEERAQNGFDERAQATAFVKEVATYLPSRLGMVAASPARYVQGFIDRYNLERIFPDSHVISGGKEAAPPTPDLYEAMARALGVTVAEGLLVIERAAPHLAAAEVTGATVVSLQVGMRQDALKVMRDDNPDSVILDSFSGLREALGMPHAVKQGVIAFESGKRRG